MHVLGAYLHDLDPVVLPLYNDIAVRWYGLAYLAGFAIAWGILHVLAKRGRILLTPEQVGDAMLAIVIGVMVGGRVGYALFYSPKLFVDFSAAFPFWGLLDTTQGGMASHGGIIGVIVAGWWIARRAKVPTLHVLDLLALVTPFGLLLGRIANFVNAELLGRIIAGPREPAPWWGVRYPTELKERLPEVQRLWGAEQFDAWGVLLARYSAPTDEPDSWAPVDRAIAALHDGSAEARSLFEVLLTARHPSQLYQAIAEGLALAAVLWWYARKPRKPGAIGAWFLIVYGVGRIATEFVRLPDAHLVTGRILGLSRGQWMSAAMVLAGCVLLLWVQRCSKSSPIFGWASPSNEQARTPAS